MDGVYENGNGSLMRILPAIFYIFINNLSEEEQINTINNMSSLTHKHEISRLGCKIFSDYIIGLLNNKGNKEEAYQQLQHKIIVNIIKRNLFNITKEYYQTTTKITSKRYLFFWIYSAYIRSVPMVNLNICFL